jgi:hypothetical protein
VRSLLLANALRAIAGTFALCFSAKVRMRLMGSRCRTSPLQGHFPSRIGTRVL